MILDNRYRAPYFNIDHFEPGYAGNQSHPGMLFTYNESRKEGKRYYNLGFEIEHMRSIASRMPFRKRGRLTTKGTWINFAVDEFVYKLDKNGHGDPFSVLQDLITSAAPNHTMSGLFDESSRVRALGYVDCAVDTFQKSLAMRVSHKAHVSLDLTRWSHCHLLSMLYHLGLSRDWFIDLIWRRKDGSEGRLCIHTSLSNLTKTNGTKIQRCRNLRLF